MSLAEVRRMPIQDFWAQAGYDLLEAQTQARRESQERARAALAAKTGRR